MKIIVSQKDKRIKITFKQGDASDNHTVSKAEDFLAAVDKFSKRRRIELAIFKKADLRFVNVGLLTERVIRAIVNGLRFDT